MWGGDISGGDNQAEIKDQSIANTSLSQNNNLNVDYVQDPAVYKDHEKSCTNAIFSLTTDKYMEYFI